MRIIALIFALLLSWPVLAQVPMTGAGVGSPSVASSLITYQSSVDTISVGPTVSYTGATWASGKNVIVAVMWSSAASGNTVSSVMVGTQAAIQVSGALSANAGASQRTDIWLTTTPPSGTGGTVSITYAATQAESSIALYSTTSSAPGTNTAGNGFQSFGTTLTLSSITVPSSGAYIANCSAANATIVLTYQGGETVDSVQGTTYQAYAASKLGVSGSITVGVNSATTDIYACSAVSQGP